MRLSVVTLNSTLWSQFLKLHNDQDSPMSWDFPPPKQGIWVVKQHGEPGQIVELVPGQPIPQHWQELVVGCCIYDTDGPMIVAEHLVSNPAFSLRVRWDAFNIALNCLRAFATSRSKWILAHPSSKGLARYLMKRGFDYKRVVTVVSPPGMMCDTEEKQ